MTTLGPIDAKSWIEHLVLDEFDGPAGTPEDIEGGPALRAEGDGMIETG